MYSSNIICRIATKVPAFNYNAVKYVSKASFSDNGTEMMRKALFAPVQEEPLKRTRKITVVGVGSVGTSIINALIRQPCSDELLLIDVPARKEKVFGDLFDFSHANSYFDSPKVEAAYDSAAAEGSDLIIVTCGIAKKPGQSHRDVSQANVKVMKECIPALAKCSPDAVFLVVTNPVEFISYAVWKYSGFPKSRVLGVGTSLDLNRLKYYTSMRIPINPFSIDAQVIGEHGEVNIPLWSKLNIAGTRIQHIDPEMGYEGNDWNEIWNDVKRSSDTSVRMGGFTDACKGLLTASLASDILKSSECVRFVSINAKGYLGIKTESFISFPAVIGNRGVSQIFNLFYEQKELDAIKHCADELDKVWKTIQF